MNSPGICFFFGGGTNFPDNNPCGGGSKFPSDHFMLTIFWEEGGGGIGPLAYVLGGGTNFPDNNYLG